MRWRILGFYRASVSSLLSHGLHLDFLILMLCSCTGRVTLPLASTLFKPFTLQLPRHLTSPMLIHLFSIRTMISIKYSKNLMTLDLNKRSMPCCLCPLPYSSPTCPSPTFYICRLISLAVNIYQPYPYSRIGVLPQNVMFMISWVGYCSALRSWIPDPDRARELGFTRSQREWVLALFRLHFWARAHMHIL